MSPADFTGPNEFITEPAKFIPVVAIPDIASADGACNHLFWVSLYLSASYPLYVPFAYSGSFSVAPLIICFLSLKFKPMIFYI